MKNVRRSTVKDIPETATSECRTCFICNAESNRYAPISTKSKHTNTKIIEFIQKFLNDNNSNRSFGCDFNEPDICCECIDKINEYDFACSMAIRVAEDMCEILQQTESMLATKAENNSSEGQLEVKLELEEVQCGDIDVNEYEYGQSDNENEGSERDIELDENPTQDEILQLSNEGGSTKTKSHETMTKMAHECAICPVSFPTAKELKVKNVFSLQNSSEKQKY